MSDGSDLKKYLRCEFCRFWLDETHPTVMDGKVQGVCYGEPVVHHRRAHDPSCAGWKFGDAIPEADRMKFMNAMAAHLGMRPAGQQGGDKKILIAQPGVAPPKSVGGV